MYLRADPLGFNATTTQYLVGLSIFVSLCNISSRGLINVSDKKSLLLLYYNIIIGIREAPKPLLTPKEKRNMGVTIMYKTTPTLEIGEEITLTVRRDRLCITDYRKNRIMCKIITPEDQLIISKIMLTNIREHLEKILNELGKELKTIDTKIDEILNELGKPKIYDTYSEAIGDIAYTVRRLQTLIKDYEKYIKEFTKYEHYKSLVIYALSQISQLQYEANVKLENDFWFF